MDALFASGRIVDAILVLVAIEAAGLILWRGRARGGSSRRGDVPLAFLCNLTSGAALMLALRAALTGAHWTAIAACLAVAGLAHAAEMVLRLGLAPKRLDPPA